MIGGASKIWAILLVVSVGNELVTAKRHVPLDRYRHRRRLMGRRIHQHADKRSLSVDWAYQGCYQDSSNRLLPWEADSPYMSMPGCLTYCSNRGYAYAGVEGGDQCFCGNAINGGAQVDEEECHLACGGGGGASCGWAALL